uniref:M23 family metallopeptidase n=1 Tax=Vaginimicrobium propionicum TaxID=1871034 RepID=UPI0012EBA52F|nr:M23 family metallopeptidase [Vaginimicrobium propionicum]
MALAKLKPTIAVGLAAVVCLAMVPAASADSLDEQKTRLSGQLSQANSNVSTSAASLDRAASALQSSRQALAEAKAKLAKAQSDLSSAQEAEKQRAEELQNAEDKLTSANDKIAAGKANMDELRERAALDMRIAHQQNTALLSIGMLFSDSDTTSNVNSRVQWAQTLYNANSSALNELTQAQLEYQRQQVTKATIENDAKLAREAAQSQLEATQNAKQAAQDAESEVAQVVANNAQLEAQAQSTLDDAVAIRNQMQAELDGVTARIQERNAQIAAQAQAQASRQDSSSGSGGAASRPAPSGGSGLATPAVGPYTSYFGWRVSPMWTPTGMDFHDGLDIGAGCNTPIYAAESGTVAEVGWANGYGNRLVLDHGPVGGTYLTTAYNHANSYTVGVGQWVSRGQQIGYIGTTGWSTGCHLHFQVWANGQLVNPIGYL